MDIRFGIFHIRQWLIFLISVLYKHELVGRRCRHHIRSLWKTEKAILLRFEDSIDIVSAFQGWRLE